MSLKNQIIGIEKTKITSYQIDLKGKATIQSIAGIFQEIAGNHASVNGFGFSQMAENKQMWVLTRLKIEVEKYPYWSDNIEVSTWVVSREKFFSRRDFEIHNSEDEKIIAASTGWMLLDTQTKRPKLVDNMKMDINTNPNKLSLNSDISKIKSETNLTKIENYKIRYSDLDVNFHVNNLKYIRILLDSYDYDWLKTYNVKIFEINYLAEATYANELEIFRTNIENNEFVFNHEIRRKSDEKVICRAIINWTKI
ncbi:MAG: hypothetical protein JXR51_00120 [Bacteroidales bacterium]|nr:hypothetical protein [Bacteroidales bacterium]MBN2755545.1 hypothetical protein [Bacteroidales bacterium]